MEMIQRLGEDICNLLTGGNMEEKNNFEIIGISDLMTVHFDLFGAFMVYMISCNLNSTSVVTVERCRLKFEKNQVLREDHATAQSQNMQRT